MQEKGKANQAWRYQDFIGDEAPVSDRQQNSPWVMRGGSAGRNGLRNCIMNNKAPVRYKKTT